MKQTQITLGESEVHRESVEQLREILENSPMGVAVVTHAADDTRITGNRLFVNEALFKMFGFASAEDMLDGDISNSWVDLDQLREVEEIMTGQDELVDYEALRRRVDGTEWWVSMNSRPLRFDDRDCTMVWHFDITERKRAEEALREARDDLELQVAKRTRELTDEIAERKQAEEALVESEERLGGAIESLQEGFVLFDVDDRLVMVNDVYRRINPKAQEFMDRGMGFEDLIRANVAEGRVMEALGREEEFIRERLEQHRNPGSPIIRQFADGKWYIIKENRTPEGGIALTFTDITELQSEKEARGRFSQAVETVPVGIALFDSDDRLVFFNNRYAELMEVMADILKPGVTFEKMIRTMVERQPVKDARGREEEFIQERIKHHRNPTDPFDIRRDNLWLSADETRLADGSIFTIIIDITERKQVEETLRESDARLRAVFENTPVCLNLKDTEGRYILVNKPYEEWLGHPGEEIIGKKASEFLEQEEEIANLTRAERQVLETGEVVEREVSVPRPDGNVYDRILIKFPVKSADGSITAIGTVAVDITERKKAEEDIRRLAEAIEGLSENFALYGPDDRLVMCNQGYSKLNEGVPEATRLGVSYEEHIRAVVAKGLAPKAMGREEDYIRERMELHRNPTEPYEVVRQDGVWLVHEQRVADGSTAIIATDITESKQAEEDLRNALIEAKQANQAKSEFLASMSHELRSPLNAILGFADIISHQHFGPTSEKYTEYAEDIQSSGEHLLALVNEILDLSTIEAGKHPLVKEKLSIKEIVGECVRIVEEKARSSGIDLMVKVPKDLSPLYADRRAAKQILLNLLSNAIKFTSEGGKITVSAKASKRNTTLKITDTGKGIPVEKLPKLTDPFIRAETNPYLAEPGWGLGLAITKSLVDLHGGTLEIQSKVGKGTTVTVTFPNEAP